MARRLTGTVISDKQDKTIVIRVDRLKTHPLYRKRFTLSNNFQVHDENGEAKVGDKVTVEETRPISKNKRWKLVEVVQSAEIVEGEEL